MPKKVKIKAQNRLNVNTRTCQLEGNIDDVSAATKSTAGSIIDNEPFSFRRKEMKVK